MKTAIFAALTFAFLTPANAQLFSRESIGGAAVGGLIGGIIGHNSGRKTAEGIGIGAGAGLLLGAIASESRRESYVTAPVPGPVVATPVYAYSYYPARPNYVISGAALGGLAGGIIGHNSGHRTGEGIAIGAGAGLLLGAVAEENARRREQYLYPRPMIISPPAPRVNPVAAAAPTVAMASQPSPIINNFSGTSSSMSGANSLFGR